MKLFGCLLHLSSELQEEEDDRRATDGRVISNRYDVCWLSVGAFGAKIWFCLGKRKGSQVPTHKSPNNQLFFLSKHRYQKAKDKH